MPPALYMRQRIFQRAPGSSATRAVTVKTEYDLVADTEHPIQMMAGRRRAQCSNRVVHAMLRQADNIHIALNHDQPRDIAQGLAGFVQAIKLATFVEQRCLGRIQIFGFAIADDPAAKTNYPAA